MPSRICSCGEKMVSINTTVKRTIGGKIITIKGVPVDYCSNCKEKLFGAKIVKMMDRLISDNPGKNLLVFPELRNPIMDDSRQLIDRGVINQDWLSDKDANININDLFYLASRILKKSA